MFPEKNDKYGFIKAMYYQVPSMQLIFVTHCNMPVRSYVFSALCCSKYKQAKLTNCV